MLETVQGERIYIWYYFDAEEIGLGKRTYKIVNVD